MKKLIKPIVKGITDIPSNVEYACQEYMEEFEGRKKVINLADSLKYIDSIEEWRMITEKLDRASISMVSAQARKEATISDMSDVELEIYKSLTK